MWGANFYQEFSSFLLCIKAETEGFSEEIIYVYKLSQLRGLCVFLSFFRGEGHGPPALVKKADTVFVCTWRVHGGGCASCREVWRPFVLSQVLLGSPGGRRLAGLSACPRLAVRGQGSPAFLAQGLVVTPCDGCPLLPGAQAAQL